MAFRVADYPTEYPFASHWLERPNGVRMHYLDEGDGPPVVMVHGNPTWSFYYRRLVQALRGTHRCIVPDHIGCGLSDKPGDDRYAYTLQSRVEDLEALLAAADVGRSAVGGVTWIVHDWGGMIGLTAALRSSLPIRRVVILNTSGFLKPATKRMPWALRAARDAGPISSLLVRGGNAFAHGATWMATKRGLPRRIRRAYVAPYDSWANRIATLRFVQDIPLSPRDRSYELVRWTDENVRRLRDVPVLIAWGRHDFVFDDHFLNEWLRRLPNAEPHVFEYAGHYVLEDAAEEIVPLISRFVRDGERA
jgi:pimeloyl-ACP methyl ester carboxylesterase